jgi:hypothetical protein
MSQSSIEVQGTRPASGKSHGMNGKGCSGFGVVAKQKKMHVGHNHKLYKIDSNYDMEHYQGI